MSVERLTPDFTATLGASGSSGYFGDSNVEAPALFKRQGIYYAVFGACCCYCGGGSPVIVHTATLPLGPYTTQNNIGVSTSGLEASAHTGTSLRRARQQQARDMSRCAVAASHAYVAADASLSLTDPVTIPAQQTHIAGYPDGTGATQWMWIGDRWQSAPDGIKGHDFTYWSPLAFLANGTIVPMVWADNFTVTVG